MKITTKVVIQGSRSFLGKTAQMSLGGRFAQSGTTVTVAGQNPVVRYDCKFIERNTKKGVKELLGQSIQFLSRTLDRSSSLDSHSFSKKRVQAERDIDKKNCIVFQRRTRLGYRSYWSKLHNYGGQPKPRHNYAISRLIVEWDKMAGDR